MLKRDEFPVGIERGGAPGREECPVVVVVFIVVACNLLLLRPSGEGLNMRMEKPATVANVFECYF